MASFVPEDKENDEAGGGVVPFMIFISTMLFVGFVNEMDWLAAVNVPRSAGKPVATDCGVMGVFTVKV
jgi:hypothetical protein